MVEIWKTDKLLKLLGNNGLSLIHIWHPSYREQSRKIICYTSYEIPKQENLPFRVSGRDLTGLLEKAAQFGVSDVLSFEISKLPVLTFIFGKDWTFEIIKKE
jgi:hypothetical protein